MFIIVAPIYSPSVPPMLERRLLVWNKIYKIFKCDKILIKKTSAHADGIEQVHEHTFYKIRLMSLNRVCEMLLGSIFDVVRATMNMLLDMTKRQPDVA